MQGFESNRPTKENNNIRLVIRDSIQYSRTSYVPINGKNSENTNNRRFSFFLFSFRHCRFSEQHRREYDKGGKTARPAENQTRVGFFFSSSIKNNNKKKNDCARWIYYYGLL